MQSSLECQLLFMQHFQNGLNFKKTRYISTTIEASDKVTLLPRFIKIQSYSLDSLETHKECKFLYRWSNGLNVTNQVMTRVNFYVVKFITNMNIKHLLADKFCFCSHKFI